MPRLKKSVCAHLWVVPVNAPVSTPVDYIPVNILRIFLWIVDVDFAGRISFAFGVRISPVDHGCLKYEPGLNVNKRP